MNHSIVTADRNTHLKVAALAVVAAMVVVVVGFSARVSDLATTNARADGNGLVIKAGKPTQFTARDGSVVR
jgi:hypothetical protein